MTVRNLIENLHKMPQDAMVWHLWDGALYTEIEIVYLSKAGDVVTSDFGMVCYDDKDRPVDAPTSDEDIHWSTMENPNLTEDE